MARRAAVAALLALALMAGVFRFTAAPGPGLDPDAMSYLRAAQTLVSDGTYRIPWAPYWSALTNQPLTHFPPGFSTLLAVPVALGMDVVQGARVVQALAAGATGALLVLLLWPVAGAWGATLGAVALALMPAYVFVHLSVLSEPAFLACTVLLLWAMVNRPKHALTHGVIAAAATMLRYAGLAFAGAAALWALRDRSTSWRTRLTRAAAALAPSLLAMAVWSITRARAPGRADTIRKFAVYGDLWPTLREGAKTIAHHLAPTLEWEPVPRAAAVLAIVTLAVLIWSTVRATGEVLPDPRRDDPRWREQHEVLVAAGFLALCYAGLVGVSRVLADPLIPLDYRMMVPFAPLAVVAVAIVGARAARVISTPARVFGALAIIGWMGAAVRANYQQVTDALADGGDFASTLWQNSPTLAWVRQQPATRVLYTNLPCAIWFHLRREMNGVPDNLADSTMRGFVQRLRETNGAVVAWTVQSPETANTDSIAVRAGLVMVADFEDGTIYGAPPASAAPTAPAAPAAPASSPPAPSDARHAMPPAPVAPAAKPR